MLGERRDLVTDLETLLQTHESLRLELDRTPHDRETANAFAKVADDLGYQRLPETLPFDELLDDAISRIESVLAMHPGDHVLLNNLGVLHCNRGFHRKSLTYFRRALEQMVTDSIVHENIRIAQIYLGRKKLHDIPTEAQPGGDTLRAYFDPHAM